MCTISQTRIDFIEGEFLKLKKENFVPDERPRICEGLESSMTYIGHRYKLLVSWCESFASVFPITSTVGSDISIVNFEASSYRVNLSNLSILVTDWKELRDTSKQNHGLQTPGNTILF